MDKKTERKWRMRQFRLRSAIFLKRNGLYLMALACFAAIGAAALLLLNAGKRDASPVRRSDDERLVDAAATRPASVSSAVPVALDEPTAAPKETPAVPSPPPDETGSAMPDFTPAPDETPDPSLSMLEPPVDGPVIRCFAVNSLIWSETLGQWMTHSGVDIAANKGDEVRTVLAGTVEAVYTDDMLGVTVVIAHENGLRSVYSSLKEAPPVSVGDHVEARQVIGNIGDTAISECAERSHLHFELYVNGSPVDPESMIIFNKP